MNAKQRPKTKQLSYNLSCQVEFILTMKKETHKQFARTVNHRSITRTQLLFHFYIVQFVVCDLKRPYAQFSLV